MAYLPFTIEDKITAIDAEIVRRKRALGDEKEPHKLRQIALWKAIAKDYRKKITQERTDDDRIPAGMAERLAPNTGT